MRRQAILGLLCLVALAAAAGGASATGTRATTKIFGTRGSIETIAADGSRVAIATDGIPKSCDRIVVWTAPTASFTVYKAGTDCPGGETSGGQGLAEVALAGTRVAWVEWIAGNLEDLSLETAQLGSQKVADVAFAENQNGAEGGTDGDYLGNAYGHGTLLAYNLWSICTVLPPGAEDETAELCPSQPPVQKETNLVLGPRLKLVGVKAPINSSPASYAVVGVDGGRVAAQDDNGPVTLFSGAGALLKKIAVPNGVFRGTAFQGNHLVTLRNGALEVYDTATGGLVKSVPVANPKGAQLRDLQGGLAVYVQGLTARVVRLSDAKTATFTVPGSGPVDAQLEASGLFYSYNLPKSTAHGRVVFVPQAQLATKF